MRDDLVQEETREGLANALAFVSVRRPLIPGEDARSSALKVIAAYIEAEAGDSRELDRLIYLCDLHLTCQDFSVDADQGSLLPSQQKAVKMLDSLKI